MNLPESFRNRESALINTLNSLRAAVDDRTGKGTNTENEIERVLLRPYLPPGFDVGKGTVVCGPPESQQSGAMDRVVCCLRDCPPLLAEEGHSIYPLECAAGVVEITMHLNAFKLREDVIRTKSARDLKRWHFAFPVPGSATGIRMASSTKEVGPRAWIIGLPSSSTWSADAIEKAFCGLQDELKTLVHGLYVLGIGCFLTRLYDKPKERTECDVFTGHDRMFRFLTAFRTSLDRWAPLQPTWSINLNAYL